MIEIPELSIPEYVSYERGNGERIICHDGIYWRMAYPLFWKPLLPYCHLPEGYKLPSCFFLGGYQKPAFDPEYANSSINYYSFDSPSSFSIDQLDQPSRYEIRKSEMHNRHVIMEDYLSFCEEAYPVYISFYERTSYGYKNNRTKKSVFNTWADNIFRNPKIIILGAYQGDNLAGVMIIGNVVGVISILSLFSSTKFLKNRTNEFLYYKARVMAAQTSGATSVLVGMESENIGLNRFKEKRGATMKKNPTTIWINPMAELALRVALPEKYKRFKNALGA